MLSPHRYHSVGGVYLITGLFSSTFGHVKVKYINFLSNYKMKTELQPSRMLQSLSESSELTGDPNNQACLVHIP